MIVWVRRALMTTMASAVVMMVVTGCVAPGGIDDTGGAASARLGLGGVVVAPQTHADTYERAKFGQRWKDTDRNGCGQRDDVLARDLSEVRRQGRCVVVAGTLTDPYDGSRVGFAKARAADVQIDHIVALADAWRSGAWSWTDDRREAFANDLAELQASAAATNRAKSDHDAATWRPADPARACTWARQVVAIKTRWGLAADRDEADALTEILATCPA